MTTVEPIRNIDHLHKLENYLAKKNPRDLLLLTLGINCGLRISDIVALNVGDVRNKSYIQIIEKKTGKYKKVPINAKLKPMFEQFTNGKRPEEPLFKTIFNNRLDRFGAYYILKTASNAICLDEKIGTHTMRKLLVIIIIKNLKMLQFFKKYLTIQRHKSPWNISG